jgi:pyruvate/2-oxoglutarate dehydrogenase complex dihydrolipoamide acyltransferase (E2) component
MMMKQSLCLAAACLLALPVMAQKLTGLKLDNTTVQVGQALKATAELEASGAPNCGLRISWGDGASSDGRINQEKDLPFVSTHTYTKPGSYTVTAEPKTVGSSLKCGGKNMTAQVTVAAPAAAAPAAPAAAAPAAAPAAMAKPAMAASACPAGWKLAGKVNAKTKAFTCTAKAGTAIPEPKTSCPGDLTYFENSKKGQLGCRV